MEYKKFEDLEFKKWKNGSRAVMHFPNGYGVEVWLTNVSGFYSNGVDTYELWVLKDGKMCFDTPVTDYVLAYITKRKITKIMKEVQKLKKDEK